MSNVDLHRAAQEAFNTEGAAGPAAYFAEDATYFDAARALHLKGKEELTGWLEGWKAAFSDATIANPEYIDAGDWTIARFQGQGTNDGALGPLPATGKRMDLPYCEVCRWEGGKLVEGALYYDTGTMMVQLGHAEPPPA